MSDHVTCHGALYIMRHDSSPRIFNPFPAEIAGSWPRQLPGPWCGAPRRALARSSCHVAVGKPRVCRRDGKGARSRRRPEKWGFVAPGVAQGGPHRRRGLAPHMCRRGFGRRHSEARLPVVSCLGLSRLVSAFSAKKVGGQVRYAAGILACSIYVPHGEVAVVAVRVASRGRVSSDEPFRQAFGTENRCRAVRDKQEIKCACRSTRPCTRALEAQAMAATGSRSRSRKPVSCSAPTSRHASASSRRAERSAWFMPWPERRQRTWPRIGAPAR